MFRALPLCLIILLADMSTVVSAGLFSSTFHKVQRSAVHHTRNFARDLRVAFGAVLLSQDVSDAPQRTRVVYCKLPGSQLGGNDGNTNNGSGPGEPVDGSSSAPSTRTRTSTSNRPTPTKVETPWKLKDSHEGNDFFRGWDFWTLPDPTHGIVDYIDEASARSNGLLEVNSAGNAVMRVETTGTVSGNRKSVRIHSKKSYNGALMILDAVHMPTGCGTWPAFWTNGPNWPAGGEIDILEGVGDYTNNQATLHTAPGCTLSSSNPAALSISGTVIGGTICAAAQTENRGCGIRSPSSRSYGAGFNANGGGVYAMQWDESGIAVYFFERGDIPSDIEANTPQPSNWGQAQARWPASGCDPFKFFYDNIMIFDTTLCGDWAGGVWGGSGIPGQEESCAARTGFSTCEAFVRARGSAFQEAYWEVRSVKVYQK